MSEDKEKINGADFARYVFTSVGDPPCLTCELYEECKAHRMACADFNVYLNTGRIRYKDRTPDNGLYEIMKLDEDEAVKAFNRYRSNKKHQKAQDIVDAGGDKRDIAEALGVTLHTGSKYYQQAKKVGR